MSAHQDEADVRGHGVRPEACDHEGTSLTLGSGGTRWCRRCGSLSVSDDRWETPLLRVPDSIAIRDRDTMYETLTIAQRRCTELVEEVRRLKVAPRFGFEVRCSGGGGGFCSTCNRYHDGPVCQKT